MSATSQPSSAFKKNYGFSAISKSLGPFLIGKGVRLFVTVAVILLLARFLDQAQYAVYISLQALVTIIGSVSSVGVQQSMLRYVPELRAGGNNRAMYWLFSRGMALRVILLAVVLLLGMPLAFAYGHKLGLESWLWILPWYAVVGLLRLTALSLSLALEALLWQKQSQYGMALGGLVRLIGVSVAIYTGHLDLWVVVLIEMASEAIALSVMFIGWLVKRKADVHRHDGSLQWWPENKKRVFKFGGWSGLMNQTRLLYGSSPNRLVVAHYMGAGELALFGFADSLNNLAQRLMPTFMMMSMVRPVVMAHYSENKNFGYLVGIANLMNRLNLSLLALPIALLAVVGEPVLAWATAGKYGEAAYLLAGFLSLMLVEGMRATLELLVQAVEKNQILLTNFIQSFSIFLSIPLIPHLGLWALIVVNITGTVVANFTVVYLLRRYGYHFKFDFLLASLVFVYTIAAIAIGRWCLQAFDSFWLAGLATFVVFAGAMAIKPPLLASEKSMLTALVKSKLGKRQKQKSV